MKNMVVQKKKEAEDAPSADKTAAELLEDLNAQRKVLVEKMKQDERDAIQARKVAKLQRNEYLVKEKETVKKIQDAIFAYNHLGKQKKMKANILAQIARLIAASEAKHRPDFG
jgi:xanthine/CO dehydrogenase XdhC/CoxF family maturation factor